MARTPRFLPLRLGIDGFLEEGDVGDGAPQSCRSIPLVGVLDVDINLSETKGPPLRRSFPAPTGTQG